MSTETAEPTPHPEAVTPIDMAAASRLQVDEVIEAVGTSDAGLTQDDAGRRLRQFGPNVLATRQATALGVLARQRRNPLPVLLASPIHERDLELVGS